MKSIFVGCVLLLCLTACSRNNEISHQEQAFKTVIPERSYIKSDSIPNIVKNADIVYPEFCKNAGIEGTVMLAVAILESGKVSKVKVLKSILPGPGGLDEAAVNYAKQLEFEPVIQNGKPAAVWFRFPVTFCLK